MTMLGKHFRYGKVYFLLFLLLWLHITSQRFCLFLLWYTKIYSPNDYLEWNWHFVEYIKNCAEIRLTTGSISLVLKFNITLSIWSRQAIEHLWNAPTCTHARVLTSFFFDTMTLFPCVKHFQDYAFCFKTKKKALAAVESAW